MLAILTYNANPSLIYLLEGNNSRYVVSDWIGVINRQHSLAEYKSHSLRGESCCNYRT